jgi:hypothetical protein
MPTDGIWRTLARVANVIGIIVAVVRIPADLDRPFRSIVIARSARS